MAETSTRSTTGRYSYALDGRDAGVHEPFTITASNDSVTVASERSAPGTRLSVEAMYANDGRVEATFTWAGELDGFARRASMTYMRTADGGVTASGAVDDVAHEHVLDTGSSVSFFPLMRIYSGRTLLRLIDARDGVDVVTPDIRDPKALDRFLQPLRDHRRIGATEATTLDVDGADVACTKVEYLGGSYDQPASVWIDEGGLLLRYTWDQPGVGDWDVRVCDIDGSWPMPRSW